jgi:cyclic pyranopterin phosphate synthase
MWLFHSLSRHLDAGLRQKVTLTTNGLRSSWTKWRVAACDASTRLTLLDTGRLLGAVSLDRVLMGIDAAQRAGRALKINLVTLNVVALKGRIRANGAVGPWTEHGNDLHRGHAAP